nr:hypothetical protein [Tanacetum cinerariifolium]
MRRVGKRFLEVATLLVEGMLVAGVIEEEGDAEEQVPDVAVDDAAAHGAVTTVQGDDGRMIDDFDKDDVAVLMDDKEEEVKDDQVQGRQAEIYKIDIDHALKVLSMQEDDPAEVQEVVDVVTTAKLITKVVTAASETVTASSTTISAAEPQVPTAAITTAAPVRGVAASTRRRKGVVIRDPKEESTTIIPADTKSNDKGKEIMVEESKPMKKKQQVKMDEEYARKLHEKLNKDINWDVAIEHSINETPAQKAAKRRKLNEEVKNLKIHLEIMPDEDDDVYTEATPLARKVSIVDYEIIHLNNKPHCKITQADGTHQLVKNLEKGNKVKVLKLRRLKRVRTSQRVDTSEDTVIDDASNQGRIIDELDKDDDVALMDDKEEDKKEEEAKEDETAEVQEVVDVVTTAKLITEVVTAASETVTAAIAAASIRRRKGVVIRDPEEESTTSSIIPADTKSKDKGKRIMVEEQQVEMDKEYARKLHAELKKDIDWDAAIDHVKQKAKEDPAVQRYQVERGRE